MFQANEFVRYEMIIPIPRHLKDIDAILATERRSEACFCKAVQNLFSFSKNVEIWTTANTVPTSLKITAQDLDMTVEEVYAIPSQL